MTQDSQPTPQPSRGGVRTRSTARQLGRALALFGTRGWALALVGVCVLAVVFGLLGRWQFGRYEVRIARNGVIAANYSAPVQPLRSVLKDPSAILPVDRQWTPVEVRGRYLAAGTVLIRHRPLEGVYGYEVVVPMLLDDGTTLFVDRGWIGQGATGARPDSIPLPPPGEITAVVRLRLSEPADARTAPAGQAQRLVVPSLAAGLGAQTRAWSAYGVLDRESPSPAVAPRLLPEPDLDEGPFLPYAVQWIAFAVTAFVVLAFYAFREAGAAALPVVPGRDPRELEPAMRTARAPRRLRWGHLGADGDWEDALLDAATPVPHSTPSAGGAREGPRYDRT